MKKLRLTPALGGLLSLGALFAPLAQATNHTNPAYLDLEVTFTSVLSVAVDGIQDSTRTLTGAGQLNGYATAGQTAVPASSATVTNDSRGLTEMFQLSAADVSTTTPNLWTLITSTGPTGSQGGLYCSLNPGAAGCPQGDQFAMQALFISSANAAGCPSNTTADWDVYMSTVGTSAVTYTSNIYADTSATYGAPATGGTGNPDQTNGIHNGNMFSNAFASNGQGTRGLCVRVTMPASSTSVAQHTLRLTITAEAGQ